MKRKEVSKGREKEEFPAGLHERQKRKQPQDRNIIGLAAVRLGSAPRMIEYLALPMAYDVCRVIWHQQTKRSDRPATQNGQNGQNPPE